MTDPDLKFTYCFRAHMHEQFSFLCWPRIDIKINFRNPETSGSSGLWVWNSEVNSTDESGLRELSASVVVSGFWNSVLIMHCAQIYCESEDRDQDARSAWLCNWDLPCIWMIRQRQKFSSFPSRFSAPGISLKSETENSVDSETCTGAETLNKPQY